MLKTKNILIPDKRKRILCFLGVDVLIFSVSLYSSLLLRFDFDIPARYLNSLLYWLPVFVVLKIFIFYELKLYSITWRYVGINEFVKEIVGLLSFMVFVFAFDVVLQRVNPDISLPRSVIIIDFFVSVFLASTFRISKRLYLELASFKREGKRVLIVGAGGTGERILRGLKRDNYYSPVGFVDDDPNKVGTYIHGIPVLGKIGDIPRVVKDKGVDIAVIAIPSLGKKKIREIHSLLRDAGVEEIKIVPGIHQLPEEIINVKDLKDISIEDLLGREPVEIDMDEITAFLKDKGILVTGAGGSIGSEIVRQLFKFDPRAVIALDIDETELYNLYLELKEKARKRGIEFKPVVGDVRDRERMDEILNEADVNIIFHAAAYKHVPMMEFFPEEAVKTNVLGTYNVAVAALKGGVEKFVNISTDKAVNPSNVMGATKRLAEIICQLLNGKGKTKFVSVRFGNVLGSRGSVLPIFLDQIKKGGPVTVTHPKVTRYFMTIPEAVLLVLQAAAMGKGGEIFVLDMGDPVRILKLAEDLIKLQGLEPYKDVDIVFTGLRPGEKLYEELSYPGEKVERTRYKGIFVVNGKGNGLDLKRLAFCLELSDVPCLKEVVIRLVRVEDSGNRTAEI